MKLQLEHLQDSSAKRLWDDLIAVVSLATLGAILVFLAVG
jgi:hypothetical protein